jgi:hypothetical protein
LFPQKALSTLLIIALIIGLILNFLIFSPAAFAEIFSGPTVKVRAIIKPYINITINSPATFQTNLSDNGPSIIFDCNQGPGIYQALYPLTFNIVSNQGFELRFVASELKDQNSKFSIPPEQLAVSFKDPSLLSSTGTNEYSSFSLGEKMVVYQTNEGKTFTTECNFQLNITYEDKAGIYDGSIFVEVFTYTY